GAQYVVTVSVASPTPPPTTPHGSQWTRICRSSYSEDRTVYLHGSNGQSASGDSGIATKTKGHCTPACRSKREEALKAKAADVKKLEKSIEQGQKSETD
ncbi:hypothetical protein IFR05_017593, partial [Cadophora sp. M221]